MSNKTIKIRCRLCDSLNNYCYKIKIYNNKNELVVNSYTDNRGCLLFKIPYFGVYKIIILNNSFIPRKKVLTIFINKHICNELVVTFNKYCIKKRHPITIIMTDKNYKGLPITKGRMILWKTNTQFQ